MLVIRKHVGGFGTQQRNAGQDDGSIVPARTAGTGPNVV
jgi:hypothetical protein